MIDLHYKNGDYSVVGPALKYGTIRGVVQIPAGTIAGVSVSGPSINIRPVQNAVDRTELVSLNAGNDLKLATDTGNTLLGNFKANADIPDNAMSQALAQPREFVSIGKFWQFDPPIPKDGSFIADLTLHYSSRYLPDDPNFNETAMQAVSYDPVTGDFETLPTTLDTDSKTATVRVNGLAQYYSLGVAGPFSKATLNLPIVRVDQSTFNGLAFLNFGTTPANLTMTSYTERGTLMRGTSNPVTRTLAPSQQLPQLAPELFNFTRTGNEGWLQVKSDSASVVGFEIIGTADQLDGVDVPLSHGPAVVLSNVEHNDVYTTEIHLSNPTRFQVGLILELRNSAGARVAVRETSL